MKASKKLGCILLVVVILIAAVACSGNSDPEPGSSAPATSASTSSSSQPAASGGADAADSDFPGGWLPTTSYDERVTFTMATVQTLEGYDYTAGDDYVKWWSDNFNYDIEVTSLTFDTWSERLRLWINSGDMPDICVFDYKHPDAASYVDQGLIKELPDGWKERWPTLASVHDKTTLGPEIEKIFDGNYFLPRARFDQNIPGDPLPDHIAFWYRKDWADAVGFPIKTTYKTSELIDYGVLVKDQDPGALGANLLPISSRPNWAMRCFVGSNNTHYKTFYKGDDGTYQWGPASQDTLTGLKLYLEAFQSGALNPEFFTLKDIDDYDQFRVSAVSGGYFGEAPTSTLHSNRIQYFGVNTSLDPDECVGVATILGEDGNYHQEDLINYWGTIIFNPDISDVKFERYMDMLDFGCTEQGYLLQRVGFEGTDWEYDANGEIVSLLPEGQNLAGQTGKYPGNSYVIAVAKLADDFAFQNPNIKKAYRDESWVLYTERCQIATPQSFSATDWDLFTFDSPSMRKTLLDFDTEYTNLVTTAKDEADLEALWLKWIEQQMPIIQPVLDELNAM
ncbi:MAG: hypothetical protein LBV27_10050 [Oscillospiraceae bacterium]|jgi:putative aldouronate transport system substrate-binding protein|nr:hypothetical protein [Oscillospiraceae bacterium]